MNYDNRIKLDFWLHIAFMVIAIVVVIFIIHTSKVAGNEAVASQNQFLETSVASWQAPMWREMQVTGIITYYTNRSEETDSTPDITASGQGVRDGIVANNCLEFGDIVEIMGNRYIVHDRMNARYGCEYYDIFTFDLEFAKSFGSKVTEINIIKLK